MSQSMSTPVPDHPVAVAVAGEALIDLIARPDGAYASCLGGASYNLARALARQGLASLYLNPLSADRFGRALAQQLDADGVRLARQQAVPQVTSLAVVSLDQSGHPDYAFYRDGVADRQVSADALNRACDQHPHLKMVCTGALALDPRDADVYLPWLRVQRQAGRCVVVDANLRPTVMRDLAAYRGNVEAALAQADVMKVSDEDLLHLGWSGADPVQGGRQLLQRCGASLLALTLGADGAWLLTPDGQWHAREAAAPSVVDTVGAGDSFLAGLLAAMLQLGAAQPSAPGRLPALNATNCEVLLRHALASASFCVQQRGCVPPTWDQTVQWSRSHSVVTAR